MEKVPLNNCVADRVGIKSRGKKTHVRVSGRRIKQYRDLHSLDYSKQTYLKKVK